jgi:N-acetylglucosamine-6-sulfatase
MLSYLLLPEESEDGPPPPGGGPLLAPRSPSFNQLASDHHPLLATAPPLDAQAIRYEDKLMQDRWGALFSIDDMVVGVAKAIQDLGLTDNTFIFFTSDHVSPAGLLLSWASLVDETVSCQGYHLGQFRIPDEKMMPYETDIRYVYVEHASVMHTHIL